MYCFSKLAIALRRRKRSSIQRYPISPRQRNKNGLAMCITSAAQTMIPVMFMVSNTSEIERDA
jgi:hypothetical protein